VRRALRLLRIALHLAAGWAASAALYPLLPPRARRFVRRCWARSVFAVLNVRLRACGARIAPGSLVVANHVSWLDAVALGAICDAAIVAKAETQRWPLIGSMLERNGTLFVERRPTRALLAVNAAIAARLARGESVAVFPEGTTTDGAGVLAFRTALFQPAVLGGHPVHALALVYRDGTGRRCAQAAYIDDLSLWQSLCAIAAHPGLTLELRSCGALATAGLERRAAARLARAAIQTRICGSGSLAARQAAPGFSGSGSPAGWTPSSAGPTWASSTEVSRT
jgi:1-acyl-sn-glycerol-3-phosphate acyltransferase